MPTVQIRLPKSQLQRIDAAVRKGAYRSRSEVIRDYIERMEFLSLLRGFQEVIERGSIGKEELLRELAGARKRLYKDYL